jgi:hypothetical protein
MRITVFYKETPGYEAVRACYAVQLEYLIRYIYYKHQTQVFYFIVYYIMFYVQQSQQAHYKSYKDLYWHWHWPFIEVF